MAFKFESQEFKLKFDQVESLARSIIEDDTYAESIKNLANHFLTATRVFNTNLDLSDYDQYIEYSRKQPVSDFVKVVDQALKKYKNSNLESDLIYLFDISLNLINIYFSELTFILGGLSNSISLEVGSVIDFVSTKYSNDPNFRRYVRFAERDLPFQIFKELFHSNEIKNVVELNIKLNEANNAINTWNSTFETKRDEVENLENKLEEYKTKYDFVLLNKWFKQRYEQKKEELKSRKEGYSAFGAMLFFTPLCSIALFIFLYFSLGEQGLKFIIYLSLPVTTFMIIVFYFVRVGLQHVRSVQSQMMQLELRMALCQFIYNYAEDSEKLHKKNSSGFEKFENIIFSPLVSSDDKIPTTFDGMEQLAKLIGEFRK